MPVQQVVRILREYEEDEGQSLDRRVGPEAVTVARDMEALLDTRLRDESAYASAWSDFLADPQAKEAGLIGALEAHIEADPALTKRLNGFIEEYNRVLAPSQAPPSTPGVAKSPVGGGVPDTTFTAEDDTTVGEGTYLYGNVRSSDVATVGHGVAGGEPEPDRRQRIETTELDEHEVSELFERIYTDLERDRRIGPDVRRDLRAAIKELEAEIGRGAAADVERIEQHLSAIEQLSPRALQIVLGELGAPAVGMHLLPARFFQYVPGFQGTRRRRMAVRHPIQYKLEPRTISAGTNWLTLTLTNIGAESLRDLDVRLNSLDARSIQVYGGGEHLLLLEPDAQKQIHFQIFATLSGRLYVSLDGWQGDAPFHWESPGVSMWVSEEPAELVSLLATTKPYLVTGKKVTCEATVRGLAERRDLELEFWAETPGGEFERLDAMQIELSGGEEARYSTEVTVREEGDYILYAYLYDDYKRIGREKEQIYVRTPQSEYDLDEDE